MARKTTTRPRKRPRQARSHETVEAILGGAARVLTKDGYERLTTNRVAEIAGVSIGSLYQYFPNKEAIVRALFERHVHAALAQLTTLSLQADAPLEQVIPAYIRLMLEQQADNFALYRCLITEVARIGEPFLVAARKRAEAMVKAFLEHHRRDIAPVDLDLAALILVSAVDAAVHVAVFEDPALARSPAFHAELSDLVLRYLAPRRSRVQPPSRPRRTRAAVHRR